ncbi:hypothetical protein HYV70_03695 [Candidatus Uhrbacteria bacterium]|nr:hypothetical protein [Candidatus Uhrbacteria bacterium]
MTTQERLKRIALQIEEYYSTHLDRLDDSKKIHWLTRHYLWLSDSKSKDLLFKHKNFFFKPTLLGTRRFYASLYKKSFAHHRRKDSLRKKKINEYPMLYRINRILCKALFSKTLFNKDVRTILPLVIPIKDIVALRQRLMDHQEDMAILSTPALNFLFFSQWAYGLDPVHPKIYLKLAQDQIDQSDVHSLRRIFYLCTHAIIGESLFYSRGISFHKDVYKKMLRFIDQLIQDSFKQISLDMKIESLVCARLLGVKMKSEKDIFDEILGSFSAERPYLIDVLNTYKNKAPSSFSSSEHRNILFVLAMSPYSKNFL